MPGPSTNSSQHAHAPLDDIRVLDLSTGPVGGVVTMVLGDFGASVIKVERPGGDPFRALPNSPAWLRGKQSLALDLTTREGHDRMAALAGAADVIVTTFDDARARRLACDYGSLSASNPGLIYCRVTGWGPKGPYAAYPGYEGLVAAKSGRMMAFSGLPDRDGPVYAAVQVGMHACSQSAIAGILAALVERLTSGKGQLVEASLLQAMMPYDLLALIRTQLLARHPDLFENDPILTAGRGPTLNYHPLQTKDGRWLQMGNLLQHLFDNYLAAVDLTDTFGDPRYEGSPASWATEDREALRDRMFQRMWEKTADEWMQIFVENGGVAATEYRPAQAALDDPDLIGNGHVHEHTHPKLGKVRQLGALARLTATPGNAGGPAPEPGANNAAAAWQPANGHHVSGPSLRAPLEGVTVVEFATVIAAPLGVSILGDLGARVIKVEPVGGDPYRGMGLAGIMAAKTNASKESIALDLKSKEGQAIVHRILAKADVVIHNYRPGVPEKLGIGYDQCKALNPKVVYVSVNGYGPSGPGAHRPSTHPIPGAALGGALWQVGEGRPPSTIGDLAETRVAAEKLFRANEANPDPNTSVVVASSALMGLTAARRFGIGQQVFVDMLGANAWANGDDFIQYTGKPPRPRPGIDILGLSATYRLYHASEGWVFIALIQDREFTRFCAATGRPALAADARFATAAARQANDAALEAELASLLATRTADEWEALLAPAGIGCVRADGPMPGDFWAADPHVRENGFVVPASHPRYGEYLRWGALARFSRTPATPGPGCLGGQHTDAILAELGYSVSEIAAFRASGVAWSEPVAALAAVPV
jgi:crotonobetainyl-CoA:carnitine CoA-transferase CaiB-like acyl-CoA transferase